MRKILCLKSMNRFYTTFNSYHSDITIVWVSHYSDPHIIRIFLSDSKIDSNEKTQTYYPKAKESSNPKITSLISQIQEFFDGVFINFSLELLDFTQCNSIQKKIICAEYKIPRKWVSTYNKIAQHLGIVNGARVVGNALAKNPFPIVIPCHRTIRSDGYLGGYQGGLEMKRALLEMEGIEFISSGKAKMENLFY